MKICIEGYKAVGEKRSIVLGGLTILSGANSSGKSSFMQPILLIKQTLENDFDAGFLMLDGPNATLTDSSQIISRVFSKNKGSFAITLISDNQVTTAAYKFSKDRGGIHIDSILHESDEFKDGIKLHLGMKSSELKPLLNKGEFAKLTEIFSKDDKVSWKVARDRCFLEIKMSLGKSVLPFGAGFRPAAPLAALATRLIHVPGLRGNPERSYKVAMSDNVYKGSFEKYVASIIHRWKSDMRGKEKFQKLQDQIKYIGLASSVDTVSINETRLEIRISRRIECAPCPDDHVNIADVGFGVSQTLPVLVALLAAKKGQVVYIEQPELHLHPRAQFNLAKIISEAVSERGVHVIIETHSSVLIRGIQILVVKNEINKDLVSLNWFSQDSESGQTNIAEAKLDKFGAFGDWPEDFDAVILDVEKEYLDAVEEVFGNEA